MASDGYNSGRHSSVLHDVLASDFNEEELKFVSELPESKSIRELKHVFLKIAQARGQTWDLSRF